LTRYSNIFREKPYIIHRGTTVSNEWASLFVICTLTVRQRGKVIREVETGLAIPDGGLMARRVINKNKYSQTKRVVRERPAKLLKFIFDIE
jgi:hypothetical protein